MNELLKAAAEIAKFAFNETMTLITDGKLKPEDVAKAAKEVAEAAEKLRK